MTRDDAPLINKGDMSIIVIYRIRLTKNVYLIFTSKIIPKTLLE